MTVRRIKRWIVAMRSGPASRRQIDSLNKDDDALLAFRFAKPGDGLPANPKHLRTEAETR